LYFATFISQSCIAWKSSGDGVEYFYARKEQKFVQAQKKTP